MTKQQPSSIRSQKELKRALRESWESTVKLIQMLNKKMQDGSTLRDEEIRFLKNSQDLLRSLELKEESITEEVGLPEGKLKEFIERLWKFKDEVGIANTRDDGLYIMEEADYKLCSYCNEFHKIDEECPYEVIAKEKAQKVTE